ncbi:MAG: hypothetical protein GY703_06810 [Gammaproteobacteria bacterium]|nr:hypothetical protein [Gammaproteobacteria bacterium]
MFQQTRNRLVFQLERIIMRGPLARFGLMLVLVVLVSLVAGILVRQVAPGFDTTPDAVWWAFLRLTDPGYLGDDQGLAKAVVSTTITVLGSILFMGALIAILVQWFGEIMDRLELGLTPISRNGHFVLLGWNSRTATILEEILVSQGRVERFLRRRGARRLYVALLAESANAALMRQLKLQLGKHWNARQIILRRGSSLIRDELERVDIVHAGAVLIPAADTGMGNALDADTRTIKTLITIGGLLAEKPVDEPPLVVIEIQDIRHADTLRAVYKGPMEIVAGDEILARLMVQNIRHPGLSNVYDEFLSDEGGSQIYVRHEPQLAGTLVRQLTYAFPAGVFLGLVRPRQGSFTALLSPSPELRLEPDDRIVVLAPSFKAAVPPEAIDRTPGLPEAGGHTAPAAPPPSVCRRVLLLGWNHRVPALLEEFASYPEETITIDIVSQVPAARREKRILSEGISTAGLEIRHLEFDYIAPVYPEEIDLTGYDNLLLLASERLGNGAESDARTIMGYIVLRELLSAAEKTPSVLVELSDPDNVPLFPEGSAEVIVPPVIVSHMMARVALRQELRVVFDELFSSGGSEIDFQRIGDYGLADLLLRIPDYELEGGDYRFADLQRAAEARGESAIGIRWSERKNRPDGGVELNPRGMDGLALREDDELILLANNDRDNR